MSLIEEIESFTERFGNDFPTDPQAVHEASTRANELIERFNSQEANEGTVPLAVIRLHRVAGSLKWLARTYSQQDVRMEQKRHALAQSDRLRLASLEVTIAYLRKQVAEAKHPHAKARAQQILDVALSEYESVTSERANAR